MQSAVVAATALISLQDAWEMHWSLARVATDDRAGAVTRVQACAGFIRF